MKLQFDIFQRAGPRRQCIEQLTAIYLCTLNLIFLQLMVANNYSAYIVLLRMHTQPPIFLKGATQPISLNLKNISNCRSLLFLSSTGFQAVNYKQGCLCYYSQKDTLINQSLQNSLYRCNSRQTLLIQPI